MSQALSLYRRLVSLPGGRWLYGRLICFKAPYFATIAPWFRALEQGRCEVAIRDRRRVHNHIGTVHAIALCNAAELTAGMMTDVTIPSSMRWIPKGMTVEYLAKATGTLVAVAQPESPGQRLCVAGAGERAQRSGRGGVPRAHRHVGVAAQGGVVQAITQRFLPPSLAW
jgi:acyl-coenzyme A thioesterase PaaI-like protein